MRFYQQWAPYVSVSQRKANALKEAQKLKKKGVTVEPVFISGRTIATTWWGNSWCENLERYSDYSNRLPRGKTYVRNGSVIDLKIQEGKIAARVSGSHIYSVNIDIKPIPHKQWNQIANACSGEINSLVELLQGRFSKGVMGILTAKGTGLFPAPGEVKLSCSCPDSASMCKHVAAALYGVGARLDTHPELLFRLRSVNETDLIAAAAERTDLFDKTQKIGENVLSTTDTGLSDLFNIDLETKPAGVVSSSSAKREAIVAKTPEIVKPTSKATKSKLSSKGRLTQTTKSKTSAGKIVPSVKVGKAVKVVKAVKKAKLALKKVLSKKPKKAVQASSKAAGTTKASGTSTKRSGTTRQKTIKTARRSSTSVDRLITQVNSEFKKLEKLFGG